MSLASLIPDGFIPPAENAYQTLFWSRIYVSLWGNDAKFDAWAATAAAGSDAEWFANRYSGYVLQFAYNNVDAGNAGDALWKNDEDGNGWCIQDARETTNYGGYCIFPYQQADATGATAHTVVMKAADFVLLKALWDDAGTPGTQSPGTSVLGDIYKTNMVDATNVGTLLAEDPTTPVRGMAPFSRF